MAFERDGDRGGSGLYRGLDGSLLDTLGINVERVEFKTITPAQLPAVGPYYPTPSGNRYTLAAFHAIHKLNVWSQVQRDTAYHYMMAPTLQVCPGACNTGGPIGSAPQSAPWQIWPIGIFVVAGVPFSVGEITRNSNFRKSYNPTPEQRFWAEWYMIKRSWNVALDRDQSVTTQYGLKRPSVKQMIDRGIVTYWPNFALNPIPPLPHENEGVGGYEAWKARGGYPLVKDLLEGKGDLGTGGRDAISFSVCTSELCHCPNNANMPVACVRNELAVDGRSASFWFRIKIDAAKNGKFHMLLDYDEPSKLTKFGEAAARLFDKLTAIICANQVNSAQQNANMVGPKCLDKNNKPCVRGPTTPAASCVCTPASSTSAISVGILAASTAGMCAAWAKDNVVIPPYVTPPSNTWMWVAAGALVVGGLLYARNR